MSSFCDVVLPVPLDRSFTYCLGELNAAPGVRVLVPFSGQRLVGFVVRVHDERPSPEIEVKQVDRVLDSEPLLDEHLLGLGGWVAEYYCAPLGEVLRGMVPLHAEVKRQFVYRIAEAGQRVLYDSASHGSSRRSRLSAEDQNREYSVLNYLTSGEAAKPATLRGSTGANKALLDAMVKKRWLIREAVAESRDARRLEKIAVLVAAEGSPVPLTKDLTDVPEDQGSRRSKQQVGPSRRLPRLTEKQLAVLAQLAGHGGRMRLRDLQQWAVDATISDATIRTLVRRELVQLEDAPEAFHLSSLEQSLGKRFAHEHSLNETQTVALAEIAASLGRGGFDPFLLYGVTGSGKTAVYIAAMQRVLAAGRSALLLVPEIGLTPATAAQMVAAFGGEVALLHSQLTPDERAEQWRKIRSGQARVVIGTRSAVFSPLVRLGLIIVDEEHDGSYKQGEAPRYHARDVAVMRAKLLGCPVVLGSATPSLESWHNAEQGRYERLEMLSRVADRPLPVVETIDMREEFRRKGQEELFSQQLIKETRSTLDRGEQVIILINRRGYSYVVMCRSCGEKIQCENCAISLTYHKAGDERELAGPAKVGSRLECHYCGYRRGVPERCPVCASEHLFFLGAGSQQGEERLAELFPGARLGRMDRDTVRSRGDMERLLRRLHSGEINLLVGTQMLAKGHDIHGVTLVGVVGADFALSLPDFRSAERVFQLLAQVSGRAGRGDLPGRVLVQSYQPDHYVHRYARQHDFPGFASQEMYFRRGARYPPVSALANLIVQSESLPEALDWSHKLGQWLGKQKPPQVRIAGPAAAPIARLKRIFRYHFLLRSERRDALRACLRQIPAFLDSMDIPRRAIVIDVDALHIM